MKQVNYLTLRGYIHQIVFTLKEKAAVKNSFDNIVSVRRTRFSGPNGIKKIK